jgi:hypothetical protein
MDAIGTLPLNIPLFNHLGLLYSPVSLSKSYGLAGCALGGSGA